VTLTIINPKGKRMTTKNKYVEEAVNHLSAHRKLQEGTDFKGSKSITITRFAGPKGDGMMIQLTGRKAGPARFPIEEAAVLGKALQDKKLLKV